jgi:PAS domain S-box-containing protein
LEVFEAYKGMYEYKYLPAYARYLLENHLRDYSSEQINLSSKLDLPVLKNLTQRFSPEQITSIAEGTAREYLEYISQNKGKEQIVEAMTKWMKNQFELINQSDISARDITLISYIRGQALKKFVREYTSDIETIINIYSEIDVLLLGSNTTSTDIFIRLLREKIAEQSKLANKLMEASPAITFLFDTKHNRQVFVSGKVFEVLGYDADELVAMQSSYFVQLIHPRDLERLIDHIESILRENSNETSQIEFRFKHKDGKYRWLRTYEVIFNRDDSGNPEYILGKTFEITAEKETAMALENREKQLLEAQRIAHIGNYEWNIKEQQSKNSEEVYRIFEMEGDEKYDQFISHVHPDDVQKVKDAVAESFITGRYECEYRFRKNDREKVIWSLGKVDFRNGEPYRMVGTVQDITEIKRMERQLLEKSAELAQSNESLRQFAFVASHDMKEPLRKIMMFSDLVLANERKNLSQKSITYLEKMQASGKNLYRMVEDILSFSLLEAKEERHEVDLNDVIREVTETLDETIVEKNAIVSYENLPRAVIIGSQFRQLFQNLVSNSLKFQRKGHRPEILITGKITESPSVPINSNASKFLEMTIADNGIGFPEDMKEKIFELFNRLHSKSEFEGTGLGLSISKRIVENHDGVISASSTRGRGAVFTIVIPQ